MRRIVTGFVVVFLAFGRAGWGQADGQDRQGRTTDRRASAARLRDAHEVRERLGLVPEYEDFAGIEAVKIAVLDYGFDGIGGGRPYLPPDAEVVEHYDPDFVRRFGLGDPEFRKSFEPLNRHGRVMAQIVWAVTGSHPSGPKLFLLNANGPTMLRRAVRFAIERHVDVILFSGSFEGGGNGDGGGPINRIVDDALAADILWINAAGNYGDRVYNGPVRVLEDGYLRLRDRPDVAALRFRNRLDENTVTVTLAWNDYRGEEDAGTDKDLDLDVEDWAGRRVGSSEKVQVSGSGPLGPDESRNPRERVVLTDLAADPDLPADPDYSYRIRVRAKKGRFTARDRVRILVTSSRDAFLLPGDSAPTEAVEFLDATGEGEIYPPADHASVLTVGDADPSSSVGPTADGRIKPDVLLSDSRAFFTDGQASAGSSNAAAYLAGVVAVLKAAEPSLRASHLLLLARRGATAPLPQVLPRRDNPPQSTGRGSPFDPPLSSTLATRPLRTSPPALRVWETPSRARLAEVLRGGR